ncbi:nucleoside hydrolase [Trametes versicolor FP-101664 SS1]|uniref:nucleoside hydrolase n=1 Tax=Trametes versicolor (strain FP-101664) TaxID=717944 RepID=UPI000462273B|nr:nucleoside hydrolase [Trametes versicolor FP-101664 SS1]EIW63339.1 nucleoside hydrolase [Trametes versicolor FP-101664 SS1]
MSTNGRIPVIIDTDPGVDDTLAILLALASPELEVLAIVVSFGNTDRASSHINILKIYQAIARHIAAFPQDASRFPGMAPSRKTILALGEDMPLQGELHSAQYFHGRDGLGDITQRHPDLNIDDDMPTDHPQLSITKRPGVEVALELIKSEPARTVSYLALGPLTNLAKLLRLDRDTVCSRIGRVVCMGGGLDVPGNTSPVAEFNFFADPYAVKELLVPSDPGHGFPLDRFVLLPLDITTPHELSFPYYAAVIDPAFVSTASPSRAAGKPPLVHFTSSFLERTREVMVEFGKDAMELHDIVAVWCAISNPPVADEVPGASPALQRGWKAVQRNTGELTRGMLVVDRRDDQGAYAPGANRAEVQAELERHHFQHAGAYESTALPAPVEVESRPAAAADAKDQGGAAQRGGVACITETPGSAALVQLLLERVWGVKKA